MHRVMSGHPAASSRRSGGGTVTSKISRRRGYGTHVPRGRYRLSQRVTAGAWRDPHLSGFTAFSPSRRRAVALLPSSTAEACGRSVAVSPAMSCPIVRGKRTPRDSNEICGLRANRRNRPGYRRLYRRPLLPRPRCKISSSWAPGRDTSALQRRPLLMICIARTPTSSAAEFDLTAGPFDQAA